MAEMLDALTSAYSRRDYENLRRGDPVETLIGKLFSVLAWGLDSVQEQAELIRAWDDIDNAHGSVLDRYGANFGVKRFGAGDAYYRLAIKVKLLAQLSGGDIDTVLDAAASLLEIPVEQIDMDEVFPDKVSLSVNEADLTPETLAIVVEIVAMIKRILASGIGIIATLRSYKEFRREVLIGTSLFDRTSLKFDLLDARRTFSEDIRVESAAFERSELTFGVRDVRRRFSEEARITAVAFEHTQLTLEPAAPAPRAFHQVCPTVSALFECSRVTIKTTY